MKTADNRKQVKRHIKRSIAEHGFAILSVNPPTAFNSNPVNYSYTVGLSQKGLPELFIAGPIPNNVMGAILKNQAKAWLREGVASLDVRFDIVKTSELQPMRSAVRMLHTEEAINGYCVELRQRLAKGGAIAQVLYPDAANCLPGEPGYDTRYHQDVITVTHFHVDPLTNLGARGKSSAADADQFMPDVLGGENLPEAQCDLGEHCPSCDSMIQ